MQTLRVIALAMAPFASYGQKPAPMTPAQPVRISGQVTDQAGEPVQYEAVGLRLPGTYYPLTAVPTGSDGKFIFPAVQPIQYELVVRSPRARALVRSADASGGKDIDVGPLVVQPAALGCDEAPVPRHFSLPFGHRIKTYRVSGRVVDARGAAVADSSAELWGACSGYGARTGSDGVFRFGHVVPDAYWFRVRGPGFLPVEREVRTGKSEKDTELGTIVVQ